MIDASVGLAILGVAVGAMFRLKVLLSILALLVVVSISFSVSRHFSFAQTALTIIASQTIVQTSYFLGLIARAFFTATHRTRPVL
jgi:hypothetical protein